MSQRFTSAILLIGLAFITLSATIDLDNLFNYADQNIPVYITKDNTGTNILDDKVATLGRVLFYDTNLSSNNTISCAGCHQQEFAFGDPATVSTGLSGEFTGRHSMRLINARFSDEVQFFWDERASSLEVQTTMPIQDHVEMGFSGNDGDPDINDLISHLGTLPYYADLFSFAFDSNEITEEKMQIALAQFVRSIQSFDSPFDEGLTQTNGNIQANFPNYTAEENLGKNIFLAPPPQGGAGCVSCHRAPEFDIGPNALNNGVITVAGDPDAIDITNTRAPSLRDVFGQNGTLNGPLMHDGSFTTMLDVINHYNAIPNDPQNTNLDPRLRPNGQPQNLNLTELEKEALIVFLKTLTGNNVYTNEKWSNPFENDGSITIVGGSLGINSTTGNNNFEMYPNPATSVLTILLAEDNYDITLFNALGQVVKRKATSGSTALNIEALTSGIYFVAVQNLNKNILLQKQLIVK
ncbi:MAG: cytochrome c peroxidase [Patiriisocius sp.]|jgi:cytochrome c peroxidase